MAQELLQEKETRLGRHEAKACPFCGCLPVIGPWHGGGPRKRMVSCIEEDCLVRPMVSGSTRQRALDAWNYRG